VRGRAGLGLKNGGVLAADAVWDAVLRLPLGLMLKMYMGRFSPPV